MTDQHAACARAHRWLEVHGWKLDGKYFVKVGECETMGVDAVALIVGAALDPSTTSTVRRCFDGKVCGSESDCDEFDFCGREPKSSSALAASAQATQADCPYYIGCPYADGAYSLCEVATSRIVATTRATQAGEPAECPRCRSAIPGVHTQACFDEQAAVKFFTENPSKALQAFSMVLKPASTENRPVAQADAGALTKERLSHFREFTGDWHRRAVALGFDGVAALLDATESARAKTAQNLTVHDWQTTDGRFSPLVSSIIDWYEAPVTREKYETAEIVTLLFREALAASAQATQAGEPVAKPYGWHYQANFMATHEDHGFTQLPDMAELLMRNDRYIVTPVYDRPAPTTAQEAEPARKPLTDEQVLMIWNRSADKIHASQAAARAFYVAREVERAHGITAAQEGGQAKGVGE